MNKSKSRLFGYPLFFTFFLIIIMPLGIIYLMSLKMGWEWAFGIAVIPWSIYNRSILLDSIVEIKVFENIVLINYITGNRRILTTGWRFKYVWERIECAVSLKPISISSSVIYPSKNTAMTVKWLAQYRPDPESAIDYIGIDSNIIKTAISENISEFLRETIGTMDGEEVSSNKDRLRKNFEEKFIQGEETSLSKKYKIIIDSLVIGDIDFSNKTQEVRDRELTSEKVINLAKRLISESAKKGQEMSFGVALQNARILLGQTPETVISGEGTKLITMKTID